MQKLFDSLEAKYREIVTDVYLKTRLMYAALGTLIFSMVANGFAYLNFYPQHDSLNHTLYFANDWEIRLGRFLLPLYGKIRGEITVPWLIGLLSIIYITVTVYLICDMLDIINKWQIFLIAGFLSTNIVITQMCSVFMYVNDSYMLALLFATLGVWIAKNSGGGECLFCPLLCNIYGIVSGIYSGGCDFIYANSL